MDSHTNIKRGSNKGFGLVFAAVFAIVAALPLFSGNGIRLWAAAVAAAFASIALIYPAILEPLNRAWFKFGLMIGKVMSPLLMSLIYAVAVIPTGLLLRLVGYDPLNRKFDRAAPSYWKVRKDDEQASSMKHQF